MSDITRELAASVAKRENVGLVRLTFLPVHNLWRADAMPSYDYSAGRVFGKLIDGPDDDDDGRAIDVRDLRDAMWNHQDTALASGRGPTPDEALRALIVAMSAKGLR